MYRIGRHVDDANIFAVDHYGGGDGQVEFGEKLSKPATLGDDMGNDVVFRFGTGVGHCGLSFGRPRNEIVAKENAVSRRGALGIRSVSPLGIRVSCDGVNQPGANVNVNVKRALHMRRINLMRVRWGSSGLCIKRQTC